LSCVRAPNMRAFAALPCARIFYTVDLGAAAGGNQQRLPCGLFQTLVATRGGPALQGSNYLEGKLGKGSV